MGCSSRTTPFQNFPRLNSDGPTIVRSSKSSLAEVIDSLMRYLLRVIKRLLGET